MAVRPRRRAWIVLGPPSIIAGTFVFLAGSGTVARVVPVVWRCASELSTAAAFRLVLVASGRPCDLDDGFRACPGQLARNLPSASPAFRGGCEGILGVPERQHLGLQFSLDCQ
jgi:hypothetical protein